MSRTVTNDLFERSISMLFALTILASLCPVPAAAAIGMKVAQPDSSAQGATLAEWMKQYWVSELTGSGDSAQGNVIFMPIPDGDLVAGDFSPDNPGVLVGEQSVTLSPGTSFVLPLLSWLGESTDPAGNCDPAFDDPSIPDALFGTPDLNAVVTLDGVPIIVDNQDYLVSRVDLGCLQPSLSGPPFTAVVFFNGVGFVANPLPPGEHTLRLLGTFIIRDPNVLGFTFGVVFDNTWHITVEPW